MTKAKILIVEDEFITSEMLKEKLTEFGYTVCAVVSSGKEAIKKAKQEKPDLVLMDIKLKGDIDGVETAHQIYSHFSIPVMFVTAYSDKELIDRAITTEPFGYLIKPFKDQELDARIKMALYKAKMEAQLKESEARYRSIFNSSNDAFLVFDLEGNIVDGNSTACRMYGYSYKELIKQSGKQIIHPNDYYLFEQFKQNTLIFPVELVNIRKDNALFHVEIQGAIFDFKGKPHLLAIVRDITKRKHAEEELKKYRSHLEELVKERTRELTAANQLLQREITERERVAETLQAERQRLFSLLNGIPGFVYLQAQDYTIRFANRYFQEHFGQPEGRRCYEILCQENKVCEGCPALRVHDKKTPQEWEWIGPDARTYEIYDYPFTDIDETPLALILGIDITKRKRMEEEIQRAQQIESVGILAGGIAHDFNNILISITGSLSLLRLKVKSDNEFLGLLSRAEKAASRARDLTQQLLAFSKGGAPVKKVTSIIGLIEDTANFSLRGSKVRCEFCLPDNLWPVEIDDAQISQVINNLIINAQQAMPQGGVIKICVENMTVEVNKAHDALPLKEGKYIKVMVKDQGVGIPKEDIHKVFDPYYTTKDEGNGLGLAISYSIIKKHNGYMLVESEVQVGTTIFIYLPIADREIFIVKDVAEERLLFGKGKILLMDDQPSVREMIRDMLIYIGYDVEVSREGDEAIERYKKAWKTGKAFDAVILDLTVPDGMGGDQVIGKLREIDPEVKAIASSGYADDPIMTEYKKYGFSGVVAKPYEIKELSEVLHSIIGVRK